MEFQLVELVAHRGVGTGQETRPDAIGDLAEPKIEACRLDLIGLDIRRGHDLAARNHGADGLARQNAGAGEHACAALRPVGRPAGPRAAPRTACHAALLVAWSVFAFSWFPVILSSAFSPGFTRGDKD